PGVNIYVAHAVAPGFNEQYFNNVATRQAATLLSVTNGGDTPNVNFSMTQSGGTSADLSVTMFANPSPVLTGGTITYSITVSNAGPNAAANVTFTDVVPAGTTFQSVTPAACATPPVNGVGTITCTLGQVASEAKVTFVILVKVTALNGSVSNTVTVASP